MAVAFASIFMGEIEKQILNKSAHKPLAWKCYGGIISLWYTSRDVVEKLIGQANKHHPTIKFTAEITCTDATFSLRHHHIQGSKIQQSQTQFKPTETFQYTFFTTCHPPGAKKGFVKEEALRLLRANAPNKPLAENITTSKKHLRETKRRSAKHYEQHTLRSEISRKDRSPPPTKQNKKQNLPFVTQYHPSVPNLTEILTRKWYLIQQQPLLNQIFKEPPKTSYRKGRSL